MTARLRLSLLFAASLALACDSASTPTKADATAKAPAKPEPEAKSKAVEREAKPEPEPKPAPTTAVSPEPPVAAPVDPNADVVLTEDKDFYGLKVEEIDGWKASWEPDVTGIEWRKPGHVGVSMILLEKPVEKVEEIERGYMAGTTISKQEPPVTTSQGWYTIVTSSEGKSSGFIYLRRVGKSMLVCDTLVSRSDGDKRPVDPVEKLVEICDSAKLG